MNRRILKYGIVTIAASSLFIQNSVFHVETVSAAAAAASISSKIVKLNGSSYLNIRDAHFLMQDKGKVLAFSVAITNNGSTQLDLMDYWLRVKTKSGKSFTSTVIDADKDITTVAPKTTQYITYYAVVDNQTKINDLSFEVVKWDFSVASYERTLGVIQYPSNVTDQVAAFQPAVMLYNNGKIRSAIKQSFITEDANNAYLTVNLLIENVGFQSANLAQMNFFVQTESLSVYNVNAAALANVTVQPKERKIVTLHATLPLAVAGKPLSFIAAQNDDTSKVKLPIGVFALPVAQATAATEVGKERMIYMDGAPVNSKSGQAFLTQGSDNDEVSLDFTLKNTGTTSIKYPDLDYYLLTGSGTNYPLTYTPEENATLLPNIEKTVTLTGEIPSTVDAGKTQLVVKTKATEQESAYIIGNYKIQSTTQQGTLGSSFAYNDYDIKLDTVERTPSGDSDLLVASLTVTNKSDVTKQAPSLGGYFKINGVKVGTEQQAVGLDNAITIAPGASSQIIVYSSIPYTTSIDSISFVATEPQKDAAGKQLYQFSGQSLSSIPVKTTKTPYEIKNLGKRASFNVLRTDIYNGENKNSFYAEIEAVNNETRAAVLAGLTGYIEDKNGVIVPLQFVEGDDKLSPNGKALISASAQISKNFDTSSYKFVMGQSLAASTGGGGTGSGSGDNGGDGSGGTGNGGGAGSGGNSGNDQIGVIVQPVAYAISGTNGSATRSEFTDLNFAGYKLDLMHIKTSLNVTGELNVQGLLIDLDYSLSKDNQYDFVAGNHNIVFEYVNNDNVKLTLSKSYALDSSDDTKDALEMGSFLPLSITIDEPNIQSKINDYSHYTLNIYDEFQGTRLLLASKVLDWNQRTTS